MGRFTKQGRGVPHGMFVEAAAIACTPAERAKVQGLNDFLVFGTMAAATLSSGFLMQMSGWDAVNLVLLPATAIAASILLVLLYREHRHG